jgi:hypothetical protein
MLILTLRAIKYCVSILLEFLYYKFLSGQKKKHLPFQPLQKPVQAIGFRLIFL